MINVALNKSANQSSHHTHYGHPERAIDGNNDVDIAQCTRTATTDQHPNRWWCVDLEGDYEVLAVVITKYLHDPDCWDCGQYAVVLL